MSSLKKKPWLVSHPHIWTNHFHLSLNVSLHAWRDDVRVFLREYPFAVFSTVKGLELSSYHLRPRSYTDFSSRDKIITKLQPSSHSGWSFQATKGPACSI